MKKGDIDYEKLYKDSIERAKGLKGKWIDEDGEEVAFMIFPELKSSDKIKAEIIDFIKTYVKAHGCTLMNQWIDWIEKQGEKSISKVVTDSHFKRAEAEKTDFVSGQYVQCRKSFDGFKENESYWFEYIGDDVYIGRSDNILNKKFHITPRQLYRLFSQQHCPKEDNANEETNAPTEYGKYVDECLNEAAKHFFSEGEDTYSVADLFYAGVRCGKSWLEKQGNKDKLIQELGEYKVKYTQEVLEKYMNKKDDEKLRKELIEYFRWNVKQILNNFNNKEVLAWVEKQGEQKPIISDDALRDSGKKSEDVTEEKDMSEYKKGFECGKQRVLKYPEEFGLCKSSAWSEEDERMYKELHNLIYSAPYCGSRKEISDWLKFLKDRVITTNSNTNLIK